MILASLIILIVLLGVVALLCLEVALLRREVVPAPSSLVGKSVVISTTGSTATSGVLHADLDDRYVLRDAVVQVVGSDAQAPAGGLVHILKDRVDLVQELPKPRGDG